MVITDAYSVTKNYEKGKELYPKHRLILRAIGGTILFITMRPVLNKVESDLNI